MAYVLLLPLSCHYNARVKHTPQVLERTMIGPSRFYLGLPFTWEHDIELSNDLQNNLKGNENQALLTSISKIKLRCLLNRELFMACN